VKEKFYDSLIEGGWLVGGMAEHFDAPGFAGISFENRILFRKLAQPEGAPPAPPPIEPIEPIEPAEVVAGALESPPSVPSNLPLPETPSAPLSPVSVSPAFADLARAAANKGLLNEALRHCEEAIRSDKLNPRHRYLRATILTELGALDEAEAAFGRTLYLDPEFILAHFALAVLANRWAKSMRAASICKTPPACWPIPIARLSFPVPMASRRPVLKVSSRPFRPRWPDGKRCRRFSDFFLQNLPSMPIPCAMRFGG